MKILLFGGCGFLGEAIVDIFKKNGLEIFTASRNVKCNFQIDISNSEDFLKLPLDYFDVVINAATVLPGGNFLDSNYLDKLYKANILGTQNLCNWINLNSKVIRILNCSTLVVVDRPWNELIDEKSKTYPLGNHVLYSSSKLLQELLITTFCNSKNLDYVHLRFSSIYGEKMDKSGILYNLFQQALSTKTIKITNGLKNSFDFLHVNDAASSIFNILKSNFRGICNFASGEEIALIDLATKIAKLFDFEVTIQNEEQEGFQNNFSKVDNTILKKYIDTSNFISLDKGLLQLEKVWK
ncbi:NAD(P)-dependent oxidoreductase [Flavobacterium oreochromis]|uniref:NAD(P)-dependent oxidoreductase n=1 Tax=Flavobacterium oreochromis TaxID=2906078 RepID=A0ABW8P7R7_9FLAO|nr:NAD(P)-dependent oxidoreductase [Flavobacterium oreochromis]OWP77584.1 hypothetical protein BWG23_04410 [Flavobacterium oreochromis]